jgi:hypothetical protein
MTETGLTPFDFKIWRGFSKRKGKPVSRGVAAEPVSGYYGELAKQPRTQMEVFTDYTKVGSEEENMLREYHAANAGCRGEFKTI